MTLQDMLARAPVVPVLAIERLEDALPLARALVAGGLPLLEVTLRTPVALDCIRMIAAEVEGAIPGVGTVTRPSDLEASAKAGALFAVSPGLPAPLREADQPIPLLPGVATATEVMTALDAGFEFMKLFPAVPAGGIGFLKSIHGPLPRARFCPTGGIDAGNAADFLGLPNVVCVGGSWVAPPRLIAAGDWAGIEALARTASALA